MIPKCYRYLSKQFYQQI